MFTTAATANTVGYLISLGDAYKTVLKPCVYSNLALCLSQSKLRNVGPVCKQPLEIPTVVCNSYSYSSSSAYPGPGRGGSRLSRDAQTSLSPDTSSSSSRGSPRRSQASRET
ncbi:hypothetical protein AMECASPLE_021690 [Ameca splendens]|uniref:Uncharacterized protein n=1 Tax=Ameca splendens TaxID=208324 RepID=A0ABV0Z295_9TELE